jgi:hypothetical protein
MPRVIVLVASTPECNCKPHVESPGTTPAQRARNKEPAQTACHMHGIPGRPGQAAVCVLIKIVCVPQLAASYKQL